MACMRCCLYDLHDEVHDECCTHVLKSTMDLQSLSESMVCCTPRLLIIAGAKQGKCYTCDVVAVGILDLNPVGMQPKCSAWKRHSETASVM